MMRMPVVSLLVVLGVSGSAPDAGGQPAPPGDREIRVAREGSVVVTSLTLMLKGPDGPLPINLVLTGRRDPSRPTAPADYALAFTLPLFTAPRKYDRPHFQLNVTTGGAEHTLAQGSVDERLTIEEVTVVHAPLDVVRVSQLAGAGAATGQLFGAQFVLTAEQIDAVGAFAERVLKD